MFNTLAPAILKKPRATLKLGEPRGSQRFECYAMQHVIAILEVVTVTLRNEGGLYLQARSWAGYQHQGKLYVMRVIVTNQ